MPSVAFRSYVNQTAAWLMTPVRSTIKGVTVLVNLTPRQMQAFCTLAMIGGIIANSVWMHIYFSKVEEAALGGLENASPLYSTADKMIFYLAIMSGVFAFTMSMVAFGAEWFSMKVKDIEAKAGKAGTKMPADAPEEPQRLPYGYAQSGYAHHAMGMPGVMQTYAPPDLETRMAPDDPDEEYR